MKNKLITMSTIAALAGMALSLPASAGVSVRATFADAALSIDAWGSQSSSSGFLQTDIAAGSTVLAAYLYSTDVWGSGVAGDVTLNGTFLASALGSLLPTSNPVNTRIYDVTSFLKPAIEASAGGVQNWSISEDGYTDGEVLVVAYQNASTSGGTAIILDGGLSTTGDNVHLEFAAPYAGGDAFLSLASSYSFGDGQFTTVDVTTSSTASRRLTSAAGGNDDGGFENSNGALITAGGVGDDPSNPLDPLLQGASYDDEFYNLGLGNGVDATPFLQAGDTFVDLATLNPSNDDNVFGLFLSSTFEISDVIVNPPVPEVPEPETYAMLLAGLGLLGFYARRRKVNV